MIRKFTVRLLFLVILSVATMVFVLFRNDSNNAKTVSSTEDKGGHISMKSYHSYLMPKNLTVKNTKYTMGQFHFSNLSPDYQIRLENRVAFQPIVTVEERAIMYDLLEFFDRITNDNNIPYILYSGTLLGSYRHHDIIPWDDDLDVFMPLSDRYKLHEVVEKYHPKYVVTSAGGRDKLFSHKSLPTNRYWWRWPYVDISFYKENATFIWDSVIAYGNIAYHPKSLIFPLKRRPMYNLYLNTPNDSYATLLWIFSFTDMCRNSYYSHITEKAIRLFKGVPCRKLADKFPFVNRYPHNDGVLEVLTYNDENITSYVVPEPHYAVTQPFSLKLKEGYSIPETVLLPKNSFYEP